MASGLMLAPHADAGFIFREEGSRAGSVKVVSFALCGCPTVAKTATPTNGAVRMADIAIRYWDFMALRPD
jgi:hypothetical protein